MKLVSVRLPDGVISGIEARVGRRGRSDFIRKAVEAGLSGKVMDLPDVIQRECNTEPVIQAECITTECITSPDAVAVLEYLREHGAQDGRALERGLGWFQMRVSRACRVLVDEKLARYRDGVLEVI